MLSSKNKSMLLFSNGCGLKNKENKEKQRKGMHDILLPSGAV